MIQEFHRNKHFERCAILTTAQTPLVYKRPCCHVCGASVDQADRNGLPGCCPHSQAFSPMLLYPSFSPVDAAKAGIFVIVHCLGVIGDIFRGGGGGALFFSPCVHVWQILGRLETVHTAPENCTIPQAQLLKSAFKQHCLFLFAWWKVFCLPQCKLTHKDGQFHFLVCCWQRWPSREWPNGTMTNFR